MYSRKSLARRAYGIVEKSFLTIAIPRRGLTKAI